MKNKFLQFQHLNHQILVFNVLTKVQRPDIGWIKAIRTAVGMTLQQLGSRLKVTKQGVLDIEKREKDGSITIKSLKEIARAMDMQFVYGFVPNDGSLEALVEKRAKKLATEIVRRTSNSMELEAQGNSRKRIQKAIQERTQDIQKELPKILWD